ncbi:MAG: NfeD family protein [Lachnospiraceae bacterium]|nr:NfeD family protein [Lachnospiraceae bacterium]
MQMSIIWLIILAVMIVVELITMGLTTIWFAGGALIAAILAGLKLPLYVQIIAFVVVSGLLLYFTRPIAMKYFNKSRTKTNVEAMIGKQAIVISEINNIEGTGQVRIGGMEWSARSIELPVIKVGEVVVVEAVEGVKLMVK